MPAPIAMFVYKRLDHARRTIESLSANKLASESDLYIFSDGPKTETDRELVKQVRAFVSSIQGFKKIEIRESPINKGLAKSIIEGVTDILKVHASIIVVEDDLVCSPYFLSYMNQALTLYEQEEAVISVHGYVFPIKNKLPESFFLRGADCWGWGTWRRGWELFEEDGVKLLAELETKNLAQEFDYNGTYPFTQMLKDQIRGKNDSWAIRWYASAFLKNKLTLYPGISFIKNIGIDNSGTHSGKSNVYDTDLNNKGCILARLTPTENKNARDVISKYFALTSGGRIKRLIKKTLRIFNS